jgi:uncharacterized membrane protein
MVVAAVLGVFGVSYLAVASPAIVIPLGAIAFLLPGGLNVCALWLKLRSSATAAAHDG